MQLICDNSNLLPPAACPREVEKSFMIPNKSIYECFLDGLGLEQKYYNYLRREHVIERSKFKSTPTRIDNQRSLEHSELPKMKDVNKWDAYNDLSRAISKILKEDNLPRNISTICNDALLQAACDAKTPIQTPPAPEPKLTNKWHIEAFRVLARVGLTKKMLLERKDGGFEFGRTHYFALNFLLLDCESSIEQALAAIEGLDKNQARGIIAGLSRNDVISLRNRYHIAALSELRFRRLTPEMLLNREDGGYEFDRNHYQALIYLCLKRNKTIEVALEKIEGLSSEEALKLVEFYRLSNEQLMPAKVILPFFNESSKNQIRKSLQKITPNEQWGVNFSQNKAWLKLTDLEEAKEIYFHFINQGYSDIASMKDEHSQNPVILLTSLNLQALELIKPIEATVSYLCTEQFF